MSCRLVPYQFWRLGFFYLNNRRAAWGRLSPNMVSGPSPKQVMVEKAKSIRLAWKTVTKVICRVLKSLTVEPAVGLPLGTDFAKVVFGLSVGESRLELRPSSGAASQGARQMLE